MLITPIKFTGTPDINFKKQDNIRLNQNSSNDIEVSKNIFAAASRGLGIMQIHLMLGEKDNYADRRNSDGSFTTSFVLNENQKPVEIIDKSMLETRRAKLDNNMNITEIIIERKDASQTKNIHVNKNKITRIDIIQNSQTKTYLYDNEGNLKAEASEKQEAAESLKQEPVIEYRENRAKEELNSEEPSKEDEEIVEDKTEEEKETEEIKEPDYEPVRIEIRENIFDKPSSRADNETNNDEDDNNGEIPVFVRREGDKSSKPKKTDEAKLMSEVSNFDREESETNSAKRSYKVQDEEFYKNTYEFFRNFEQNIEEYEENKYKYKAKMVLERVRDFGYSIVKKFKSIKKENNDKQRTDFKKADPAKQENISYSSKRANAEEQENLSYSPKRENREEYLNANLEMPSFLRDFMKNKDLA